METLEKRGYCKFGWKTNKNQVKKLSFHITLDFTYTKSDKTDKCK